MLDLACRFGKMTSASPSLPLTNSTNYQTQQDSQQRAKTSTKFQIEEEEDWEEDFAFGQEFSIPQSLQNAQASLNRDKQCLLQFSSKIQDLKSTLHQVQTTFDPLMQPLHTTNTSTPLTRDIQLSKILIDMSEDSSRLLEPLQLDTPLRNHLHRFLFFCDLPTWETLAHSPSLDLDNIFYGHSSFLPPTKDIPPIPNIQWINLLASKTEVLQSRLEKYLTELHCVSRMASHI
ncbi:hypothetical protein K7432_013588 [Basidiobolus ranarum]|uniref:Uncharacterized protein n=1 Tax=Basidiobolus ranarum TaxID=34480 RepID=A0ABR2WJ22_9FUNG